MRILFVRHGATNLNMPRRMQGASNSKLNENGISQAEETREKLKNENINVIISSPQIRALETAQIINKEHNIEIIIDDRIKEMNYGEIEGDLYKPEYWNMDFDYASVNGENITDFIKRVYNFIDEIKEKYKDKTVLITSHGGVSRIFRCYFEGIPENKNLANYGIKNCEVMEIDL